MKKMKTLKILLALSAIIGLVAVTMGVTFAHYTGVPSDVTTGTIQERFEEDWWLRMREHMEARWEGIEDESWYNDMIQYMEDHWTEIHNQEWFNEMLEYMEEHGHYNYRYRNYEEDYPGFGSYGGRGFGCRGW
jgi:hypothetical protein